MRLLLLIAGNLLLVWAPLLLLSQFASDFELFVGRFHPSLVHLPIGILLAALGLEVWRRRAIELRLAVDWLLYAGAWTAILACGTGILLSRGGGYDPATLAWHRALGISIATVASAAWLLFRKPAGSPGPSRVLTASLGLLFVALVVGGHLGGILTHQEGYMTRYLPESIRSAVGLPAAEDAGKIQVEDPSTTTVYASLVHPILETRCLACHNDDTRRGRFSMTTHESLLAGGGDGEAVLPGSAAESPLVQRIWLPPEHSDHMPPKDRPQITVAEAEILRWWIDAGASEEQTIDEMEIPEDLRDIFDSYGLGDRETGIFALDLPRPDTAAVSRARAAGLRVAFLAQDVPYLDVRCGRFGECLGSTQLEELGPLMPYVAQFDAGGRELAPGAVEALARFEHLTMARLQNTGLGDEALLAIRDLEFLEVLNVFGDPITDAGLANLGTLPALKRLYAWQTEITSDAVDSLRGALPRLEVILGGDAQ